MFLKEFYRKNQLHFCYVLVYVSTFLYFYTNKINLDKDLLITSQKLVQVQGDLVKAQDTVIKLNNELIKLYFSKEPLLEKSASVFKSTDISVFTFLQNNIGTALFITSLFLVIIFQIEVSQSLNQFEKSALRMSDAVNKSNISVSNTMLEVRDFKTYFIKNTNLVQENLINCIDSKSQTMEQLLEINYGAMNRLCDKLDGVLDLLETSTKLLNPSTEKSISNLAGSVISDASILTTANSELITVVSEKLANLN